MAAKIRGAAVVALLDTTPNADEPTFAMAAFQKNCTLNMNEDTIETTNKDSTLWKEYLPGNRDWSVDADGMLVETNSAILAVENAYLGETPTSTSSIRLAIKTPASDTYWTGTAIIKSLKYTAADNGVYTAAIAFTGTGPLVRGWDVKTATWSSTH